jgi:hypothetical protein
MKLFPGRTCIVAAFSLACLSTHALAQHQMPHDSAMAMAGPLGISTDRMGSGTTWIPDAVTLPSRQLMLGRWDVMWHGFMFAQYDKQQGKRGDEQIGSLNWLMLMASRSVAGGQFQARGMFSLDAAGVSDRGYPLLLQSGETYRGAPLHDRQHPHEFWMEVGALYERAISRGLGLTFYVAPSGEPALGPVAFMHRPSAMDNPAAPISHHWQDATHTSFGVVTLGLFTKEWKLEASAFNGREPDENRWQFDRIRIDSYSSRVTFNPTVNWSLTGGFGFLKSPEGLKPAESMHRISASAMHGVAIGSEGQWASAVIYGANKHGGSSQLSQSVLAESEAIIDARNTLYGRAEIVQKRAEDLSLETGSAGLPFLNGVPLPGFPADQTFNVGALSVGYIREVGRTHGATLGLGASGTMNLISSSLQPYYGARTPLGLLVFFRLRPYHRKVSTMPEMDMQTH